MQVLIANGTLEYNMVQESALKDSQYSQWSTIVYTSIGIIILFIIISSCSIFGLCILKSRCSESNSVKKDTSGL